MIASLILLAACMLLHIANARDVLELQGVNFELALTSYKYIAVAFHDNSDFGESMHKNWVEAAQLIRDFEPDSEIATVRSIKY